MSRDLARLSLVVQGKTVIHPCIEIMALSSLPREIGSSGYVRFFDAFVRRYGNQLRYYQVDDSTKWKAFRAKDRLKVAGWFSDRRSLATPILGLDVHTGDIPNEPQLPLFEMMLEHVEPECPRGMFRIALPVDASEETWTPLLELVDDAMHEFPVHWGTAGYAFYWNGADTTIERYAEEWLGGRLLRHPGLGTGDYMTWGSWVEEGVANIGWLTFVGDALIDRLGGRESLAAKVGGTGIVLRTYTRGVALQAGAVPELGDVNRRDTLPLYHEVGRLLEPVFAPEEALEEIVVTGIKDPDESLAWLRRFLP